MCCNRNYHHKFDEKLKERFVNTYKFSNYYNNKFVLMLRKGVCPCEYIDDWEKFNEISISRKKDFYSYLNIKDITDADYAHLSKDFEIKHLGEYHDLYVQSNTLSLADVLENFRNMCLKIYELDPSKFLSAPGLAWQGGFKKTKIKLDLFTNIDMLLMVEKGIRRGICHSVFQYAKANNKYTNNCDKNEESSYIQYWDVNNLYGWAMSQKLPVNNFEWIKDTSQFNEDLTKTIMKKVIKDIFSKLMFNILKNYMKFIMIYHFYLKE